MTAQPGTGLGLVVITRLVVNLVVAEDHECFTPSDTGASVQAVCARTEYTPKT